MPVMCCQLAEGHLKAKFTGNGVRETTMEINLISHECNRS
uniref:Uncharacterized protein n=1 Tax=Klebsiella pneumoniae subsp. pneumoniae TaxID=72407 RepID=A0A7T7K6P1_KLEPN|nr:hypothetical protein [Klebsiella pneumoniae subsp. pneumoniae]